jgi:hypothetical protein
LLLLRHFLAKDCRIVCQKELDQRSRDVQGWCEYDSDCPSISMYLMIEQ